MSESEQWSLSPLDRAWRRRMKSRAARAITPERLLEENEALRQIIREALPWSESSVCPKCNAEVERYGPLLERMHAAIGEEKA